MNCPDDAIQDGGTRPKTENKMGGALVMGGEKGAQKKKTTTQTWG
jgi:hypothetical protein